MNVVILAGGKGTRLTEETTTRPKPMIEIGGHPLLWHIMSLYAHYGFKEFLIACGYKGEMIKEYFHNFLIRQNDYVINLRDGSLRTVTEHGVDWEVGLIDTGFDTMTGGRLARLKPWLGSGRFMATYGDGLGDVDIRRLLEFHLEHGKLATVTAVRPPARFGELVLNGANEVLEFSEKPQTHAGWINGGFFVFEPEIFDYLGGDETILEREPLERLTADRQLVAYRHSGFWQPMDTLREKLLLESLWASGSAPWKVWR